MNSVDRVKELCKEYKIPVSRLEKELGFSNGYISQLRKVLSQLPLNANRGLLSCPGQLFTFRK